LRQRVAGVVARYHYRPNQLARGLIAKSSRLLGVVMPSVSGAFHAPLLAGIEGAAHQRGYNVLVSNVSNDFARERSCYELLWEHRVDGVLLAHENTPGELEALRAIARLPMVLTSIHIPDTTRPTVGIDDERAAYDLTAHLIRLGHRTIGAVFNNCYSLNVLRRRGYESALRDHGLAPRPEWITLADCTFASGEQAAGRIFSGPAHPTALLCVSDEMAIGAMNYLTDAGFQVPGDVSVAGFDGIELGALVRPRLTTVRQPIGEIGAVAAGTLAAMLDAPAPQAGQPACAGRTLPHQLLARGSTAPPRAK
jgi:LacI family transcriptional regulator